MLSAATHFAKHFANLLRETKNHCNPPIPPPGSTPRASPRNRQVTGHGGFAARGEPGFAAASRRAAEWPDFELACESVQRARDASPGVGGGERYGLLGFPKSGHRPFHAMYGVRLRARLTNTITATENKTVCSLCLNRATLPTGATLTPFLSRKKKQSIATRTNPTPTRGSRYVQGLSQIRHSLFARTRR